MYNKRRLRKKTNAFVVSLAVADPCVGISVSFAVFVRDNKRSQLFTEFTERDVDRTLAFSRRFCGEPL